MGAEREVMTLEQAGVQVIDCLHKTPPAQEEGLPYVGVPQIADGRIDLEQARKISEKDFELWTQKADPEPNDVVLSRRCNPGVTAHVPPGKNFAVGQNLVLLRSDRRKIFPPFLQWLTRSEYWWREISKYENVGAVFNSLRIADIPKFQLPVPPVGIQRLIDNILGPLNEKIELNRHINQLLEQMAQTLFKSWFIDFDPVVYKAVQAGNPVPEQFAETAARHRKNPDAAPVSKDILDLFPDRFEESALGPIPAGWHCGPLDKIAHFLNGLPCQKFPPSENQPSLPVIKIRELRNGLSASTDRVNTEIPEKYIVEDGDVLFSWSGSLLIDAWTQGRSVLNQHVFKVTSEVYPKWFYYYWTLHHLDGFSRIAADKATTMGHIKRHHLTEAMVVVPDSGVIEAANKQMAPLFDREVQGQVESRKLGCMRDALLPKLISGELRVPEVGNMAADGNEAMAEV